MQINASNPSIVTATDAALDGECAGLWLFFRVSGAAYALPLLKINKVLPVMSLRDVPGTAGYVRGLMNVHGQSLPVIDFADLAGVTLDEGYQLDSPILLIESAGTRLGLLISSVLGIDSVDPADLQVHAGLCEPGGLFAAAVSSPYGQALSIDVAMLFDRAQIGVLTNAVGPTA